MGYFELKFIVGSLDALERFLIFFFTMIGAKRHIEFVLVIFAKKDPQNSESALKDLSIILHNKRGKRHMKIK